MSIAYSSWASRYLHCVPSLTTSAWRPLHSLRGHLMVPTDHVPLKALCALPASGSRRAATGAVETHREPVRP